MLGDTLKFHVPGFNRISQQCTKIPDFILVSIQGTNEGDVYITLGYMTRFVFCRCFFPPAELFFCTRINSLAWMGYLGLGVDVIFEGNSVGLVHLQLLCLPLLREIQ